MITEKVETYAPEMRGWAPLPHTVTVDTVTLYGFNGDTRLLVYPLATSRDPLAVTASSSIEHGETSCRLPAMLRNYACTCDGWQGAFAIAGPMHCERSEDTQLGTAINAVASLMTLGLIPLTSDDTTLIRN